MENELRFLKCSQSTPIYIYRQALPPNSINVERPAKCAGTTQVIAKWSVQF